MGPSMGNGMAGMELGGPLHANGSNQPPATEYTLQGVMRFLQTEWHRHERERNSWEIEKQEMKGRIANLEGQARRADATQKALRKYVSILEKKVKDQAAQAKGSAATEASEAASDERASKIQEKLRASSEKHRNPSLGGGSLELEKLDDEKQRQELKTFLDQCQEEFLYLMITPANPLPPRDSPPPPLMDDLRDVEYGMSGPQLMERHSYAQQRSMPNNMPDGNSRGHLAPNHAPPIQPPPSFPHKISDQQSQPMMRTANEQQQQQQQQRYPESSDWTAPPVSVTTTAVDEGMPGPKHAIEALGSMEDVGLPGDRDRPHPTAPDADGWDFPEGTFPEPVASQSGRPDTDVFPAADNIPKSPNRAAGHRRKGSMSRRRSTEHELGQEQAETGSFKLRFGLRGHLAAIRTVIFSGGGSPGEPEICTGGDDGMIKRFNIPRMDGYVGSATNAASDLNVIANFTHRGHSGAVLALTSWSPSPNFSTGGRAIGDGWIFSGGQDATIRVWERGRVDPKATLEGHTDAVWTLCVLPTTLGAVFGNSSQYGSPDRILLASGGSDGTVRLWSVSAPPHLGSPQPGAARAPGRGGRVRGNSMSSGSGFSSSPQASMASSSPFSHTLIHTIKRADGSSASPTCIAPLGTAGETFVVSYTDSSIVVYNTETSEQVGHMESTETYDGSIRTSVNSVVAATVGLGQAQHHGTMGGEEEGAGGGPTSGISVAGSGVEGTIISGHEDRFVRFFDANSGQCTYNMLAHPDAISSLSLSPDSRELVSAGHDGSLRFWSLETRSCTQEMTSHRVMRGEGTCSCVWSQDGKWVVSGGGDGMVKVFAR